MKELSSLLHTESISWSVGPYHSMVPGPVQYQFELDGEIVSKCSFQTGFVHKGLEKIFELKPWATGMAYADRVDPETAIFGELAYCLAVEEILELEVPKRAQQVRVILSELSRLTSHLGYIVRMAQAVGAETIVHYVLRDREKILDLFELLTGARFSLNYLRIGGLSADISEGFIERVLEVCDLIQIRLKEYNDLFSFNHLFLNRTAHVGVLSTEVANQHGVTGPNLRASGGTFDVRKAYPYTGFEDIEFTVPVGRGELGTLGDAHDRFLVRLWEVSQSIDILRTVAESVSSGESINSDFKSNGTVQSGEAIRRVETARGMLSCHVVSRGGDRPLRVHFSTPSMHHISASSSVLIGARVEDLSVVLASLDISVAEVDR